MNLCKNSHMLAIFAVLLLYQLVQEVQAESCCGQQGCMDTCPWNSACSKGTDYQCMNHIAGSLKCRDESTCRGDYDDCVGDEVAYRTGHLCRNFPFYNGGYPMDEIRFDSEIEEYKCEIESEQHHYCSKWSTLEFSIDEFEIGNSTCVQESPNAQYCQAWHVEQEEIRRCWKEYKFESNKLSNHDIDTFSIVCCNADNHHSEGCCREFCEPSHYNAYGPSTERADCVCEKESNNGKYCAQWHCEEYTDAEESYGTGREFETYICQQANAEETYCSRWTGDVESIREFEVSRCNCSTPSSNGEYCHAWTCDEKGADFWWPNTLWSLFSGVLTAACGLFLVRQMRFDWNNSNTKKDRLWMHFGRFLLSFFTLGTLFIVIGVWKAGLFVLCVSVVVGLLPFLVLFAMCYDNCCRYERGEGVFNCLYELPEKIVFTTAVYSAGNNGATTVAEHDQEAFPAAAAIGDEMEVEMTATSRHATDRVEPMGEVVVPEGGFDLEYPPQFFESDSSSSTSSSDATSTPGNTASFWHDLIPTNLHQSYLFTQFEKISRYSLSSSNSSSNGDHY